MTWAPDYTTREAFRAYLKLDPVDEGDDPDDAAIRVPAIGAASREIDRSAGRQFGFTDDGEVPVAVPFSYVPFYVAGEARWYVSIDDLFSTTDLDIDGTAYDATTATLLPLDAPSKGRPWMYLCLPSGSYASTTPVVVTAHWGWTDIPAAIVNATHLQASRIVKRRDAPFGVAGSPEMGNEIRLLAKLDPDVEVMVRAYRRYW